MCTNDSGLNENTGLSGLFRMIVVDELASVIDSTSTVSSLENISSLTVSGCTMTCIRRSSVVTKCDPVNTNRVCVGDTVVFVIVDTPKSLYDMVNKFDGCVTRIENPVTLSRFLFTLISVYNS